MTGDPLGDILLFAAPPSIAGVFLMALVERIVPVLPSHGLYAAIGVAVAEAGNTIVFQAAGDVRSGSYSPRRAR